MKRAAPPLSALNRASHFSGNRCPVAGSLSSRDIRFFPDPMPTAGADAAGVLRALADSAVSITASAARRRACWTSLTHAGRAFTQRRIAAAAPSAVAFKPDANSYCTTVRKRSASTSLRSSFSSRISRRKNVKRTSPKVRHDRRFPIGESIGNFLSYRMLPVPTREQTRLCAGAHGMGGDPPG